MSKNKNKIKTIQKKCLRRKKYKNKQIFCYARAVLSEYPAMSLATVFLLIIIGGLITWNNFSYQITQNGFGLQTSLISDLTQKIQKLTGQIDDRKKCTEDKYWKPSTKEVCNYYLYQQENKHCAKFNVPTTRVAVGEKMCCRDNDKVYKENKDKLVACPGADIFFKKTKMFDTKVVPNKDWCGMGACEFYPGNGFHAKLNEDGSFAYDADGNIILEKDCEVTQEVTPCNKPCGGGTRYRTVQTANCLKIKTPELCNPEPCAVESY